jgi:hypothetical protein
MLGITRESENIGKNGRSTRRPISFFFQYLVSPLMLLVIGYLLNQQAERSKQVFNRLELDVKRIDVAQNMLTELFSGIPERAFVADRLLVKLVDSTLGNEISSIISRYYSQKLNRTLSGKEMEEAEKIATAASAIGGPAADSITIQMQQNHYYIVVASIKPSNEAEAVRKAEDLAGLGYNSEIYYSWSGYLAVTIGYLPFEDARSLLDRAVSKGNARPDSYLVPAKTFSKRVYPKVEGTH